MRPAPARSPARSTGSWRDATSARPLQMLSRDDLRARYPDMPSHLARGLGATYAAVVEIRDTEAINQVRRETEMRDGLGSGTRDDLLATRDETAPQSDRTDRLATRSRVSSTMNGRGSCPRPSRPRRSGTPSAPRWRGCWTPPTGPSHIRRCRCAGKGSRGPPRPALCRQGLSAIRCRDGQHGGPCARWSMSWPTPNTKDTARQTWTAKPSGARSIERLHGQGADRHRGRCW